MLGVKFGGRTHVERTVRETLDSCQEPMFSFVLGVES